MLEKIVAKTTGIATGIAIGTSVYQGLPYLHESAGLDMRICSGAVLGLAGGVVAKSAVDLVSNAYKATENSSHKAQVFVQAIAHESKDHIFGYFRRVNSAFRDLMIPFIGGAIGAAAGGLLCKEGIDAGIIKHGSAPQYILTYMLGNIVGYSTFAYQKAKADSHALFSKKSLKNIQELFCFDYINDLATFSPVFFPVLHEMTKRDVNPAVAGATATIIAVVPYYMIGAALLYEHTPKMTQAVNSTIAKGFHQIKNVASAISKAF